MKIRGWSGALLAVVICELIGLLGSFVTRPEVDEWYQGLAMPLLQPPAWVFGPVWTLLYLLMGIAAFLVWRAGWHRREVKSALCAFAAQLVLNALWSPAFFLLHNPWLAFVVLVLLWLAIILTIYRFASISKPAAWLLAPYILWVTFAGYLNLMIALVNP